MKNADESMIEAIRAVRNTNAVPYKVVFRVLLEMGKVVTAHRVPTLNTIFPTDVCMETVDGLIFTTSIFNLYSNTKENYVQEKKQRKTYKRANKMQWLPWSEKYLKEGALVKCKNGKVLSLISQGAEPDWMSNTTMFFSSFKHKTGENNFTSKWDIVSVLVDNRELIEEQHAESNCKFVSLSLTQDEAQVLRDIIGHCVIGDSEKSRRKFVDGVFNKLKNRTKRNYFSETGISPDNRHISFEDEM